MAKALRTKRERETKAAERQTDFIILFYFFFLCRFFLVLTLKPGSRSAAHIKSSQGAEGCAWERTAVHLDAPETQGTIKACVIVALD